MYTSIKVAPVLDYANGSPVGTRVEYWAAGQDCCGQRADFRCDESWNVAARSGVVMLKPGRNYVECSSQKWGSDAETG
jgi:hypothetical protein